jgi:hypothetical protein
MSELVRSFDVDPEAYEYAAAGLRVLQAAFWNGRVLRDTNGKPIQTIDQLMIAYQSGTWPGPCKVCGVVPLNEAGQQEADALARREAAAILGEVERETA